MFHKFVLLLYNININVTQYRSANLKLSNSKIHKLKSAAKNESGITLRLSSNMIGNKNNEASYWQQVSELYKAFENNLSVNIKLSKTLLFKIIYSGRLLEPLLDPIIYGLVSGTITLIISNKEMEDVMKMLNLLKNLICW